MKHDAETNRDLGADSDIGTSDGRPPWDWQTRFPLEAKKQIRREAVYLFFCLMMFGVSSAIVASLLKADIVFNFFCSSALNSSNTNAALDCYSFSFQRNWIICYFVGGLGGTTFSIKWLMHSVGTGKWHQDRILWRVFVPLIGGVYAIMVHGLSNTGLVGGNVDGIGFGLTAIASISFLVGYFSDGVSGLLTNVANTIFGTVIEKK